MTPMPNTIEAEIQGELSGCSELRLASTGEPMKVVQFAPGKYAALVPRLAVPAFGLVQLVPAANGHFRPVVRVWNQHVRLGEDLGRHLGLPIDRNTFIRLIKGDFVRARKPGPGTYLIDLVSLWEHLEETEDPDFWTPARREAYSQNPY